MNRAAADRPKRTSSPSKRRLVATRLALLTCLALGPGVPAAEPERKVLIIGIDGLRPDALERAATPNLDQLIRTGAYASRAQIQAGYKESDTVSGPGWASILTGVWANKHGIHDNRFLKPNLRRYPHFFAHVKAARPDALTVSMVSWAPIDSHILSGADLRQIESLPTGATLDLNLAAETVGINTRDGQWHHLVGRRAAGKVQLFLDGRAVGEASDTAGAFDLTGEFFYIGRDSRTDATQFDGELDQVRLWKRMLTDAEIKALVKAGPPAARTGKPEQLDPKGLVAGYHGLAGRLQIPLTESLAGLTQGDFTVEAWFKTADTGRNILLGNFAANAAALNLELHTDNRVRLYVSPGSRGNRLVFEDEMDGNLAQAAARVLREKHPTAMFVYFHQVDAAGHTLGFSPEVPAYLQAIENVDRHVGQVIEAVGARLTPAREDWLIIVCTDHGGLGTQHGGGRDEPQILTVPIIVSGPAARVTRIHEPASIVDVVPTALTHLGIALDPAWELDGRPIGLKR